MKRKESGGGAGGFFNGRITVAKLLPMRSIPFKVICLIGMNDNAYPRNTRALGFDLISRHPLAGGPFPQKLMTGIFFLECILSARTMLYISYVGQSISDNSLIEPSVVVSELTDYIKSGCVHTSSAGSSNAEKVLHHVHIRQPLQPFSKKIF